MSSSFCKAFKPLAASPMRPETNTKSPSLAPFLVRALPWSQYPVTWTEIDNDPLVVSPPIKGNLNSSEIIRSPSLKSSNHASLKSSMVNAKVYQAGVAPQAAKSLRATATER